VINPLRSEREAFRLLVYVLVIAAFVIAVALVVQAL
jgi:Na+-translocating ferredoxin:NAD+ oxidoreductase RnfE subunit